jgi:hypothetical protein
MFDTPLFKNVGAKHEVVCDRKNHIVTIFKNNKEVKSYQFVKFGDAISFYAMFKKVKDIPEADRYSFLFKRM